MSVEPQYHSSTSSGPHPLVGVASSSNKFSNPVLHHSEPIPKDEISFGLLATATSWSDLYGVDEPTRASPIEQWRDHMRPVLYGYREFYVKFDKP